jgi:hypothetical protein
MADLHALADQVMNESTLREFMSALAADWETEREKEKLSPSSPYGPGANGWENGTIGAFLGSAAAWGESTATGTQFYSPPENPWARFAHILLAGKFYE